MNKPHHIYKVKSDIFALSSAITAHYDDKSAPLVEELKVATSQIGAWLQSLIPESEFEVLKKYGATSSYRGINVLVFNSDTERWDERLYLLFTDEQVITLHNITFYSGGYEGALRPEGFREEGSTVVNLPAEYLDLFSRVITLRNEHRQEQRRADALTGTMANGEKTRWKDVYHSFPYLAPSPDTD